MFLLKPIISPTLCHENKCRYFRFCKMKYKRWFFISIREAFSFDDQFSFKTKFKVLISMKNV